MADILTFTGYTKLDIPADDVLNGALGELSEVLVVGHTKDGNFYIASSTADGPSILWLIENAKRSLFENIE